MLDTMSNTKLLTEISTSPEELRVTRDRAIAMSYVEKGCSRTAVSEIRKETGIEERTIYRAIKRQLAWAQEQTGSAVGEQTEATAA